MADRELTGNRQVVDWMLSVDRFLRVSKIDGTLTDGETKMVFSSDFDYSTRTGYLSRVNHFSVTKDLYDKLPRVTLADEAVQAIRVSRVRHTSFH